MASRARLLRPRRGPGLPASTTSTSPTPASHEAGLRGRRRDAARRPSAGSPSARAAATRSTTSSPTTSRPAAATRVAAAGRQRRAAPTSRSTWSLPNSFNDAQEVADRFKHSVPVILNLQTADGELSKRLIDFASGLTYALDGGMQRIAEKIVPAHPAQRRGLRRGEGAADREGLLQPVVVAARRSPLGPRCARVLSGRGPHRSPSGLAGPSRSRHPRERRAPNGEGQTASGERPVDFRP